MNKEDVIEVTEKMVLTSEEGDCMVIMGRSDGSGAIALASEGVDMPSGIALHRDNVVEIHRMLDRVLHG